MSGVSWSSWSSPSAPQVHRDVKPENRDAKPEKRCWCLNGWRYKFDCEGPVGACKHVPQSCPVIKVRCGHCGPA